MASSARPKAVASLLFINRIAPPVFMMKPATPTIYAIRSFSDSMLSADSGAFVDSNSQIAGQERTARKKDVLPLILLSILLAGIVAVMAGAALAPQYRAVPALLWSLGFCVSGMLLGFLFGIPRTLPSGTVNVAPPDARSNDGAPAASTSIAAGNT